MKIQYINQDLMNSYMTDKRLLTIIVLLILLIDLTVII